VAQGQLRAFQDWAIPLRAGFSIQGAYHKMPRRSSGPRLWFDKKRGTWTIVDGRIRRRTGFTADEIKRAEKAIGEYTSSKHVVKDSATPFIADVLAAYSTEHLVHKVSGDHIFYDIRKLGKWWGAMRVAEVTAKTCRAYAAFRKAGPSARRELAFLNAAIKFWHQEHGPLKVVPVVVLPAKPSPRTNFMTREQAAIFLRAARTTPHLARFFIIGWYTGSRRSVIAGLKWSMIDLNSGVMKRKEANAIQTKKRAPPVKMGSRLLSHMRRWHRIDGKQANYVVHFRNKAIKRPCSSWDRVRDIAGLPAYVTPHVLRHSRATTLMKAGVSLWEASKTLGMSVAVLETVYGHHHPDWQKDAANAR
jgi:integrase